MRLDTKITDCPIWERCVESQLSKEDIESLHGVTKVAPNFRFRSFELSFRTNEYFELLRLWQQLIAEQEPDENDDSGVLREMSKSPASGARRLGDAFVAVEQRACDLSPT